MKTLQEQRTESVLKMQEHIEELEKENAELKGLVNQYKASKCSGISLVNRNMIMSDQLTKAKEIIKKLYSHVFQGMGFMELNDYNVQKAEAEQFISEVKK